MQLLEVPPNALRPRVGAGAGLGQAAFSSGTHTLTGTPRAPGAPDTGHT